MWRGVAAHGQTKIYTKQQLEHIVYSLPYRNTGFSLPAKTEDLTLNVLGGGTRIKGQCLASGDSTGGFQWSCVTSLRGCFQNRLLLTIAFNVRTIISCEQVQYTNKSVDGIFFHLHVRSLTLWCSQCGCGPREKTAIFAMPFFFSVPCQ